LIWWQENGYRIEIPLENVEKIEVNQSKIQNGKQKSVESVILIHLLRPVTFLKIINNPKPTPYRVVSPLDLNSESKSNSACQILNYWNTLQVVQLKGELDKNSTDLEKFLKKLSDREVLQEYSFSRPGDLYKFQLTRTLTSQE
jgi:hypothetical protein